MPTRSKSHVASWSPLCLCRKCNSFIFHPTPPCLVVLLLTHLEHLFALSTTLPLEIWNHPIWITYTSNLQHTSSSTFSIGMGHEGENAWVQPALSRWMVSVKFKWLLLLMPVEIIHRRWVSYLCYSKCRTNSSLPRHHFLDEDLVVWKALDDAKTQPPSVMDNFYRISKTAFLLFFGSLGEF